MDPPAYTLPYDHALCDALARRGLDVTLVTSGFHYGEWVVGGSYAVDEAFYSRTPARVHGRLRQASRLVQHVPDMARYARRARAADLVHVQWLSLPPIDTHLLPRGRPLVVTAHDVLPREPRPGQLRAQRRLYRVADAVVVHSRAGRERLIGEVGLDASNVTVIPHGAFTHLLDLPDATGLPPELDAVDCPVVLLFGLQRPYKGIDVAVEAWRAVSGAELWIVGMPRMDLAPLKEAAPPGVRFIERFIADREIAPYFERADLVILPYRQADQSGVLFTALAFGRPMILSAVGGFPEIAEAGAAALVEPGDADGLGAAISTLLADPAARARLGETAARIARSEYSWERVAASHEALYRRLVR